MKYPTIWKVLLPLFPLIFISACAITEQYTQNYLESSTEYAEPAHLNVVPENSGLLLIDAVTKKALNTMPLTGVAIVSLKEPGNEILVGSFGTGGFLNQTSGVVVIPGLVPGPYRIVKVKTSNANLWETMYMPLSDDFVIDVKANTPVYVGQIQIKHPMGSLDREIKIIHETKRERESWKLVLDKYKNSPWGTVINEYIKTLN